MTTWNSMRSRITASVRTTNRMNNLLADSMRRRRIVFRTNDNEGAADAAAKEIPKKDVKLLQQGLGMQRVYKIIQNVIYERLSWDRFSCRYDTRKALRLAQDLAAEIRNQTKVLIQKSYRIVCVVTIAEKRGQGICYSMRYFMNQKMDNFTKFVFQKATYYMIVMVFLVHKD